MDDSHFSHTSLLEKLRIQTATKRFIIAYSGGMDSHVLLHSISKIKANLQCELLAIHINHGISENADLWEQHCFDTCEVLDIKFESRKIESKRKSGESLEAWARDNRYRLLSDVMNKGDVLLTAQHKDDQAETLLLQLLRGAGVKGLAAMPECKPFSNGTQMRPLLEYSRADLLDYANKHNLQWIEDASNEDTSLMRNYLRHRVMPVLVDKWGDCSEQLSRVTSHMAEANHLLNDLAEIDLQQSQCLNKHMLDINGLQQLSPERKKNLIRYWLDINGLNMPSTAVMKTILQDMLISSVDAQPAIDHDGITLRRYKDKLVLVKTLPEADSTTMSSWNLTGNCHTSLGHLTANKTTGKGIRASLCEDNKVIIKYRHGGEKIQPIGTSCRRELKKVFQENDFFPWYRNHIPLLYIGDQLVSIAGFCNDQEFCANGEEEGWDINWSALDMVKL